MSELTIFEQLGIEYEERDGIFYPLLSETTEPEAKTDIGKYGLLWMEYLKVEYSYRYRNLVRFGKLNSKAREVNEMAYELLEEIERRFFQTHKVVNPNSFTEMYRLRMEARILAEELVLHDIVHH
ncbi:MAG: TnpV protein [Lachnospiraceae bacterium]